MAAAYEHEDRVKIWGIAVQESYNDINNFVESAGGLDFPVLMDQSGWVSSQYEFCTEESYAPFPRQVLVDPEGRVHYLAAQYYPDTLYTEIDGLLLELDAKSSP